MGHDPGRLEKLTLAEWQKAQEAALSKIRNAKRKGDYYEVWSDIGKAGEKLGKDLPVARAGDEAERREALRREAEAEASKPFNLHMARPAKTPTTAQIAEIEDAIKKQRYQQAIDKTIQYYGIDVSNVVGKVRYDRSYGDDGLTRKTVTVIGPSTFTHPDGGAARTASTILHEVTHSNQIKHHGDPRDRPGEGGALDWDAYEMMAYRAEVQSAKQLGLPSRSADVAYSRSMQHLSDLGERNQYRLLVEGQYWDMKPTNPR